MADHAKAVRSGVELRNQVAQLGASLGLEVQTEEEVGRRLWGARRRIDVVLRHRRPARRWVLSASTNVHSERQNNKSPLQSTTFKRGLYAEFLFFLVKDFRNK